MGGADKTKEELAQELAELRQRVLAQHHAIFDDLTDIIFMTDEQGTVTYANRSAIDFFGFSPVEQHVTTLLGDDVFVFERLQKKGKSTHSTLIHDIKMKHLVDERSVLFTIQPKLSYKSILEDMRVSISVIDKDGRYLFLNKVAAASLGGTMSDLIGKSLYDFFSHDVAEAFAATNRKVIESDTSSVYESEIELYEGKRLHLVSEHAVTNQDGEGVAYQHNVIDITDFRQAKSALLENEAMLQLIFDQFPGYISWKDRNSVYLGANQALAELAGVPDPSHMIGKTHYDFFGPPEVVDIWHEDDQRVIITDTIVHRISQMQDDFWVSVYKIPLHHHGEVIGLLAVTIDVTDIKIAEQKLEESRKQYQTLFEAMLDGFALCDLVYGDDGVPIDYRYVEINPAYRKQTGVRQDVIGKTATEVFPSPDPSWIPRCIHVALTGESFETEMFFESLQKWYKLAVFKTKDDQFAIVFHDITQQKIAEQALLHEKELLHALMDNITDGIYFKDRESRFTRINKAQAAYLNIDDPEQAVGKTDYDFFEHEFAHNAFSDEQRLMDTGKLVADKVEYLANQDAPAWVSATKVPIRNADGDITGLVGISRSITERIQSRALLQESENRFRQLAENIEQVFWLSSVDWQELLYVSPAYEKIWGRSVESLLANPDSWTDLIIDEDKAMIMTAREQQSSGNPKDLIFPEYRIMRPDGTIRWIAAREFPIKDENGNVYRYAGVAEDITARKETEQELHLYRQQLEELVKQRTHELSQANEELQQLANVKDQFVSNVSHELRTPLSSLKIRRQLISYKDKNIDLHLDVLSREIDRLDGLISSLLLLSRLDQDRVELDVFYLNLNNLIEEYASDRAVMAEQDGISLHFEPEGNLPLVQADRGMLEQVVSILLTNAVSYTPSGGQITLKTHTKDNAVGFSVNDTGPGIPTSEHKSIFTRFYRGNSAQSSSVVGTGLGLAIAKEIIDRHNGEIAVESEGIPGQGTSFIVWLPR